MPETMTTEEIRGQLVRELEDVRSAAAAVRAEAGSLALERASGDARRQMAEDGDSGLVQASVLATVSAGQAGAEREILAAIGRIDAGTFGVCVACGAQIPPARLGARPRAATCVACAD